MSAKRLDHLTARMLDHPLRYHVESGTRAHVTHLCDLGLYRLNGKCSCEHFEFTLEGILAQGISPEDALAKKLVTLRRRDKPDKDPRDALHCEHLIEAWRQHGIDSAKYIVENEKIHAIEARRSNPPADSFEKRREIRDEIRHAQSHH